MRSILGIDTASPTGSVALRVDGTPRGSSLLPPGGHSSGLAAGAAALLADAGLRFADLSGIAVSRGPGSFTGLRIGLAWAKGVAFASGVPLLLVSAHEAAAHAAADAGSRIVTVTPGERREAEIALWAPPTPPEAAAPAGPAAATRPRLLEAPRSVPEGDLAEAVEALVAGLPFVAVPANAALAALLDDDAIPRVEPLALAPSVAAVGGALLLAGETADLVLAAPAYGRAPNARRPSP